jgi:2-phospho-L-lactate guanylyltransferase
MINIVIPMKEPLTSKQRLSSIFNRSERHDFALELFKNSLAFFSENFPEHHLLVVTNSTKIAALSKTYGAGVLVEINDGLPSDLTNGLTNAVSAATRWSEQHNFDAQLVIPADIAQLEVSEIQALLNCQPAQRGVVICPSTDNGTNALFTQPPGIIDFCYGRNSADKHQQNAETTGVLCQRLCLDKLSIDVDFPIDLQLVITTPQIINVLRALHNERISNY